VRLLDEHLRGERLPIEIVHATEWIGMDDKAAQAVRNKRDSSMRVGLKLVREGAPPASSPPATPAPPWPPPRWSSARWPASTAPRSPPILPTSSAALLLLDVGANVDCKPTTWSSSPSWARCTRATCSRSPAPASACSPSAKKTPRATSSPATPSPAQAAADQLHRQRRGPRPLQRQRRRRVCDGFVGNVALKTSRASAKLVSEMLRESSSRTVTSQVGALLSRKAFNDFKKRLDYSEYGGAPLLGVRGVCIVGHGSSNEKAIMNGIRVAAEFAQAEVNSRIDRRPARNRLRRLAAFYRFDGLHHRRLPGCHQPETKYGCASSVPVGAFVSG
jgi:glycerol-3-phosphate acyltransferase PlsX